MGRFVFVCLEEILIFSADSVSHIGHVRLVLKRIFQRRLFVSVVSWFYYSHGAVTHERSKGSRGKSLAQHPILAGRCSVCCVLLTSKEILLQGLVLWLHYLIHLSLIMFPCLGPQQQRAFAALKQRFTRVLIAQQPNHEAQSITEIDASNTGVGAVPSQKIHPCAYLSP